MPFTSEPPGDRYDSDLMWLAVDLDNTLARTVWPEKGIGEPIWENIGKCVRAQIAGYKIIIHTSRPWHDYELIEWWLNENEISYSRIVCGKLMAAAYIDDRNIAITENSWIPEREGQ